jgi:hypothetical protein
MSKRCASSFVFFIVGKTQICNNDFDAVPPFGQIFAKQFNIRRRNASVAENLMCAWAKQSAIITLHLGKRVNFLSLWHMPCSFNLVKLVL